MESIKELRQKLDLLGYAVDSYNGFGLTYLYQDRFKLILLCKGKVIEKKEPIALMIPFRDFIIAYDDKMQISVYIRNKARSIIRPRKSEAIDGYNSIVKCFEVPYEFKAIILLKINKDILITNESGIIKNLAEILKPNTIFSDMLVCKNISYNEYKQYEIDLGYSNFTKLARLTLDRDLNTIKID